MNAVTMVPQERSPWRPRISPIGLIAVVVAFTSIAACDAFTDPNLPAWPDDGVALPVGEYRFAMEWESNDVALAGSTTARMRILESTMDDLTIQWMTGPGAADTSITTGRVVRSDSAFYHLVAYPGTAAPFYVKVARPGGAERIDCGGGFPVPSSVGYYAAPMACSLRLIGP